MDKLENLKKGKRFSSEYQPSNYRKQRLFTKIACMLGDEKFSVTFSKKDFYDIYQTLASMTRKELIDKNYELQLKNMIFTREKLQA